MVVVQPAVAKAVPSRMPAFTPSGAVVAIVLIALVAALGIQAWLSTWPPVRMGSTSAVLGEAIPCSGSDAGDGSVDCYLVPFAEARDVGIGFTVRNDAPIPMTIVAAEVIREGVLTPAVLEPQLTTGEPIFGLDEGIPFEPIEVAAGAEQEIQFVGRYGDCEAVARDYLPGSGLSVSQAFLTLRWAIFDVETTVPLTTALALRAPTGCP